MRDPHSYPPELNATETLAYVEYDPATGDILFWGRHMRYALDYMIEDEKRHIVVGTGTPLTHRVDLVTKMIVQKEPVSQLELSL